MASYQNGVLSHPTADSGESSGLLQWPGQTDFSGGVGGNVSDLSLVPDLDASTPAYWHAFGPGLGMEMDSSGQPHAQAGGGVPWLLIGGLAVIFLALR